LDLIGVTKSEDELIELKKLASMIEMRFAPNDPGLKIFKVYYCMGTGDVFYLGSIESGIIRFWQKMI
jgi:hypothetical protein